MIYLLRSLQHINTLLLSNVQTNLAAVLLRGVCANVNVPRALRAQVILLLLSQRENQCEKFSPHSKHATLWCIRQREQFEFSSVGFEGAALASHIAIF